TVVERVALVGAAIGERVERAPLLDQHDRGVAQLEAGYGLVGVVVYAADVPHAGILLRDPYAAAHRRGERALAGRSVIAHSFSLAPGTPSLACTTRSTYSATFGSVTRLMTS